MKSNFLRIVPGGLNIVKNVLEDNEIEGKILYVSDEVVDKIYECKVKNQIEKDGKLRIELADCNTISYAM